MAFASTLNLHRTATGIAGQDREWTSWQIQQPSAAIVFNWSPTLRTGHWNNIALLVVHTPLSADGPDQRLLKRLLKPLDESHQRDSQCLTDLPQFQEIKPPCPGLVIANERLWLAEFLGHIHLPEASLPAKLPQQRQEGLLLFPVGGEPRAALLHSTGSIETP